MIRLKLVCDNDKVCVVDIRIDDGAVDVAAAEDGRTPEDSGKGAVSARGATRPTINQVPCGPLCSTGRSREGMSPG